MRQRISKESRRIVKRNQEGSLKETKKRKGAAETTKQVYQDRSAKVFKA